MKKENALVYNEMRWYLIKEIIKEKEQKILWSRFKILMVINIILH